MYKPGQYLGKAVQGDDLSRREALPAIWEGLTGLVAAFYAGSLLSPSEAHAQSAAHAAVPKRLTIDEYYQQATPADDIMPGARVQDFGYASVKTHGNGFPGDMWADYYVRNKEGYRESIRDIFRKIDGDEMTVGNDKVIFDFQIFDDYWARNVGKYSNISFEGKYMSWSLPGERKIVVIPMNKKTIKEIIDL